MSSSLSPYSLHSLVITASRRSKTDVSASEFGLFASADPWRSAFWRMILLSFSYLSSEWCCSFEGADWEVSGVERGGGRVALHHSPEIKLCVCFYRGKNSTCLCSIRRYRNSRSTEGEEELVSSFSVEGLVLGGSIDVPRFLCGWPQYLCYHF